MKVGSIHNSIRIHYCVWINLFDSFIATEFKSCCLYFQLADNTNQSDSSQHVCLTMASQEHLAANMCKIELPQVFRYHNCSASDSKIALTHVLLDKVDQLQVSEACKSDLNCLYNVSMCDDNGEADQPTLYQCTTSRSATCRNEWNAVLNENIGLLNCSGVPSASPNCNFNKTSK